MNFLVHLHLSDVAGLPLSGAVLGDVVRGRLEGRFPRALERSLRLHRRIDVVTDAHPLVAAARERFGPGERRYAGILLDLLHDHCFALDWPRRDESLAAFARRAAQAVGDDAAWRLATGKPAPDLARFERLLRSYADPDGVERSIAHVASRLREPQRLQAAARDWPRHLPALRRELPALLADLEATARSFASDDEANVGIDAGALGRAAN